ncbi:unnamed protein product [Schistosoma mattheei]|uniref:Uncharacterized protein n=1 Tax=Schistosoma mattheei TaxID=31246 RepID=A0A3P8KFB6_9TREM|nr:unnamed protein product [Schistosoma mattheei]
MNVVKTRRNHADDWNSCVNRSKRIVKQGKKDGHECMVRNLKHLVIQFILHKNFLKVHLTQMRYKSCLFSCVHFLSFVPQPN